MMIVDDCETLTHTNYQRSWYNDSAMFTKRMKNGEIHVVITYISFDNGASRECSANID